MEDFYSWVKFLNNAKSTHGYERERFMGLWMFFYMVQYNDAV